VPSSSSEVLCDYRWWPCPGDMQLVGHTQDLAALRTKRSPRASRAGVLQEGGWAGADPGWTGPGFPGRRGGAASARARLCDAQGARAAASPRPAMGQRGEAGGSSRASVSLPLPAGDGCHALVD
jgi:hypothetical protein